MNTYTLSLRQRHAASAEARAAGEPPPPKANRPETGGAPASKSLAVAYFLWALPFLGAPPLVGLHHLYLGRDLHCFLYWISFGGFGLGVFRDLWRLPAYVHEASSQPPPQSVRPPLSVVRCLAALYFGSNFSLVLRSLWPAPEDSPLEPAGDAAVDGLLGALGTAVGVWLVGSATPQACSFRAVLGASAAGTAAAAAAARASQGAQRGSWLPLLAALAAERGTATYPPLPAAGRARQRRGLCGRVLRLVAGAGAFWGAVGVGVVQHGSLSSVRPDGAARR